MRENYSALSIHNNNKDKHLEHSSIHHATYYVGFWRRYVAGLVMPTFRKIIMSSYSGVPWPFIDDSWLSRRPESQ